MSFSSSLFSVWLQSYVAVLKNSFSFIVATRARPKVKVAAHDNNGSSLFVYACSLLFFSLRQFQKWESDRHASHLSHDFVFSEKFCKKRRRRGARAKLTRNPEPIMQIFKEVTICLRENRSPGTPRNLECKHDLCPNGLSSYKAEKFMKEFEIWNISRKPKQSGLLLNSCDVYGISHGWENYDFLSAKYLNCDESESKLAEIC